MGLRNRVKALKRCTLEMFGHYEKFPEKKKKLGSFQNWENVQYFIFMILAVEKEEIQDTKGLCHLMLLVN